VLDEGTKHIQQALARLEPGGRLVAIVADSMKPEGTAAEGTRNQGTGKASGTGGTRSAHHMIRANLGVDRDIYKKYGTSFPTRFLVIDKNPPSGRPMVTGQARDAADLIDRLLIRLEVIAHAHRDAVRFANGKEVLLQRLNAGITTEMVSAISDLTDVETRPSRELVDAYSPVRVGCPKTVILRRSFEPSLLESRAETASPAPGRHSRRESPVPRSCVSSGRPS
jgi:hypothetical protein